ncbi:hypothetical protein GT037_008850 [Alternaria burnsii]|uniref:Heterokaryon incompatibility domain-containing protein n=1 Tax=Alternaria burnsii TaxID=1187904 RepID=A0A8H7B0R4_9PLEO|nr:uncharacterized protein GT037_008850 [Alternaria burnsii]KAF7672899.1 hypothetical protein GT037_008850 [Alternaria burnsii]
MKRTQVPSEPEAFPEKRRRFEALSAGDDQDHHDTSKTRDKAVHEELSTLCSRCSSIDVEGLSINMNGKFEAIKLMSLGKLGVEAELSSCSLCRFFHAVKILDDNDCSVNDYALYLTAAPPPYSRERSVLAVAREEGSTSSKYGFLTYLRDMGASRGFIACSEGSDTGPHAYSLRARSIDPGSICYDNTIRGWIKLCDQQHRGCCNIRDDRSASGPEDMKLIDCKLRQIVPALPSYRYSALSYVWGTSSSGDDDQRSHKTFLPTILPRTIEDAISVTKVLDLRYLWVDRYCIDQENDAEKQTQIQQMDLIYQHAFVTIVAAAGNDPHFGLPGVGATSRHPQPTAWIKGRCLVSTLPDPRLLIKASKWMQRAWTYQESFFSTRRIVFTEQQVYYECRKGSARETWHVSQSMSMPVFLDPDALSRHRPTHICRLLEDYCGRELSVESDAIRAFEGVFHNYRRKHHVHQYRGIPIMPLTRMIYLEGIHRSRGEAFAAGLTWSNRAPGARRSLFPTWSWAGWTVSIRYQSHLCVFGLGLGDDRPLKIFIENCDGSLSDMDELSDDLLDQGVSGSSSKFIHIEAWTIPINIQYKPNRAEESQYNSNWYNGSSGYIVRFQRDEAAVQVPMIPLYQKNENDITTQQSYAPDFKNGSFLGIVLGRCEDRFRTIFIMVVHEKNHYYERVGHIILAPTYKTWFSNGRKIHESIICGEWTIFRSKERRTIRLG